MKSWITDGRGIATLIAVSLLVAALTGCARSEQSLACAKLQLGQWVQVQGHWGVVGGQYDNNRRWVHFAAGYGDYYYPCEDLQ